MEALVVNLKDVGVEQLNPGLGIVDMGLNWISLPEDELAILNERITLASPTGNYIPLPLYTSARIETSETFR